MRLSIRVFLAIGFVVGVAVLVHNCARLLREEVPPWPTSDPDYILWSAPWKLNPEFLRPENTSNVLIVVDVVRGREPLAEPLDHLAALASTYGERPAAWVRLGQAGAPRVSWDRAGTLHCPEGPLDPRTSYVFVRYVGDAPEGWYGLTETPRTSSECGGRVVFRIQIAQEKIARSCFLWLNRRRLEENDLTHEFGHVLGLGTNPSHAFLAHGLHCVNPDCALAGPHLRAIHYGVYRTGLAFGNNRDFCSECKRDIEQAKRYWRTGESSPQAITTTDEAASTWIGKLPTAAFRSSETCNLLMQHGKRAMPGLMRRLPNLPGGSERSARANADWVAKTIVMDAAKKRAKCDCGAGWKMGDQSAVMLDWWAKQGTRFMAGDDWDLPPAVSIHAGSSPITSSPQRP